MKAFASIAALALASSAGMAAAADAVLVIKGVAAQDGHIYLNVQGIGDLDGDGVPDDSVIRLQCTGGELRAAHLAIHHDVASPRDSASGQASGKRTHKPVTFLKEWGAATPQLGRLRPGYNIKENKGARMSTDGGGWTAIELTDADSLCAQAAAAVKATKSRSNIQNN